MGDFVGRGPELAKIMSESFWDRMEACAMWPGLGTAGRHSRECPGIALFMSGAQDWRGCVWARTTCCLGIHHPAHTTLAHGGFSAVPHSSQVTQRGHSHPHWDPHLPSLKRLQVVNGELPSAGEQG